MKKRVKENFLIVGVVLFILVLSFSFVSASWFSDFWGKITGHVVEEDCSNGFDDDNDTLVDCDDSDCAYTVDCVPCYDSDGGIDYTEKGYGTGIYAGAIPTYHTVCVDEGNGEVSCEGFYEPGASTYIDDCIANAAAGEYVQLNEPFCGADGKLHVTSTNCQYGCDDLLAVCYCGKDESSSCEYGCNISLNVCNSAPLEQCDSSHLSLCLNSSSCTSAGGYWYNLICNSEAQGNESSCIDSDGGSNPPVKGTVSNSSTSYTDYCNDGTYLIEYSCDGINIANDWINCNDFIAGSNCSGGRCMSGAGYCGDGYCNATAGESSSSCSTDCGESNQTTTPTTNQTTTTTTPITPQTPDLEQPTIPTTNQTIPIPEQTITAEQIETIHEINEMNILGNETSCLQGCFYEEKCLSMGIRKKINKINVYCNTTSMWDIQKGEDWPCDNHYECRSNFCTGDKCLNQGFFMRIINWFRRLFGVFGSDAEELNQTFTDNETIPVDDGTNISMPIPAPTNITNQTIPINQTTPTNQTSAGNETMNQTNITTTNQTS